jgi:hypothetical protein
MKIAIASTFAAALLAASSLAFAADNSNNSDGMKTDNERTGSIKKNNKGDNVPIEDRQFCIDNPADSKCQNLGGEDNQ